jgi:hypothetical protein
MTSPGTKPFRRARRQPSAKAVASAVLCQICPVGIPKSNQARCTAEAQDPPCAFPELAVYQDRPVIGKADQSTLERCVQKGRFQPCSLPQVENSFSDTARFG